MVVYIKVNQYIKFQYKTFQNNKFLFKLNLNVMIKKLVILLFIEEKNKNIASKLKIYKLKNKSNTYFSVLIKKTNKLINKFIIIKACVKEL